MQLETLTFFQKNLHTNCYMCDGLGNVNCQSGWRNPLNNQPMHILNPCLEPIFDDGCIHGECKASNVCTCEVGW